MPRVDGVQVPVELRSLAPVARAERRGLVLASLLGALAVAADVARPWPLAIAVEAVVDGQGRFGLSPTALLVACGVAVVAATAATGWIDMGATVQAERAAERIGSALRGQLFDHALGLSLRWHDTMRSGELMSRLTTDVGRLLDALVAVCATLVPDVLRLAVVLALLVLIDPWLALVALAVVPVLAVLALRQRRRVRAAQDHARTQAGRFATTALDLLRNVRAVQAFGRAGHARDRFGTSNAELLSVNTAAVTTEARWRPVADVTLAIGTGLVLVVGGRRALSGSLGPAELLVVMSYLAALYAPVRALSRLSGVLAKAGASARRVREVLACADRVVEPVGALAVPIAVRDVRFEKVRFGYADGRPVLDGLEFVVRTGETVCLMGPSGAGKSTILHLLLRLYDVEAGRISVNGIDIRHVASEDLRRRIAFVPQDPWLIDASIADNIAFGTPAATRHGVLAAARLAGVAEFADRLPDGLDTVVGENGSRLSGGQRRRIAIARAVVAAAPVLLLDEPTASLDPANAAAIADAIGRSGRGRAVLLVTHDPALAARADRVVEIGVAPSAPTRPRPTTRKEVPA